VLVQDATLIMRGLHSDEGVRGYSGMSCVVLAGVCARVRGCVLVRGLHVGDLLVRGPLVCPHCSVCSVVLAGFYARDR